MKSCRQGDLTGYDIANTGQESGNSLVDILWGAYNPSARLPYTIAKNRSDYPAQIVYVNTDIDPMPHVPYTEQLEIDYRHFLAHNITPRYGFGYGLSYTTFELCNLRVHPIRHRHEQHDGKRAADHTTQSLEDATAETNSPTSVATDAHITYSVAASTLAADGTITTHTASPTERNVEPGNITSSPSGNTSVPMNASIEIGSSVAPE
jgi:hypothetical protein